MHIFNLLADGAAADGVTKALAADGSLVGQGLIVTLVGVIGWFVKSYLAGLSAKIDTCTAELKASNAELKAELKTSRVAVDQNTRSVTVAVLGIAALIPGSRPILEEAKANADTRLKADGL